jgi:starch synthase
MGNAKVLFISQEITPYLPETEISNISRYLPQGIQELGKEIRTFMPRFGKINERRHQLHEVIRLSGMNLIINDADHPLIIKVASLQQARMQVYFIDNEDYFHRKAIFHDENGEFFKDNDERMIFFARGVLETVKKLRWAPDVIHCHGWFTSLIPLYLKKAFQEDPLFQDSKIVYSLYDNDFNSTLDPKFKDKLHLDGVEEKDVEMLDNPDFFNVSKMALNQSDGIIIGTENIDSKLYEYAKSLNKPLLENQSEETFINEYSNFYDDLLK